jgi:hypothetical protein
LKMAIQEFSSAPVHNVERDAAENLIDLQN